MQLIVILISAVQFLTVSWSFLREFSRFCPQRVYRKPVQTSGNTLDTVGAVEKLVAFYVEEHNERLPHSAFHGQTPHEMYFGTGDHIPEELEAARRSAR